MPLIFDIETDGLDASLVYSLVIYDTDKNVFHSFTDHAGYEPVERGIEMLHEAPLIVGHNIIGFDLPQLKKLYGLEPVGVIRDTLIISRLIFTSLKEDRDEYRVMSRHPRLIGSHSLEAWGYRLGILKDTFGKTTDWSEWTPEMQTYCEQDVRVTCGLWKYILNQNYAESAIELEHAFAHVIKKQEDNGFPFDREKAVKLYSKLSQTRDELTKELQDLFPPEDKGAFFTPKRDNKTKGYKAGVPVWKPKITPFNPGSRQDIAERLIKTRSWKPTVFTDTGQPKIDETVLSDLRWPEAERLSLYFTIQKRIGQLAEGDNAWLKLVQSDGRIHGRVITNGAVTGRCTHQHPNIAQVPSSGAPYGRECRELFYAPAGYSLLGCDASSLELRCLSHYMARYDNGAYGRIVLTGDVHWANTQALGLVKRGTERDKSNEALEHARAIGKRWVYAFMYGAGDVKLGAIAGADPFDEAACKKRGHSLRSAFMKNLPAFEELLSGIKRSLKRRPYLLGLDGRRLHIRSEHSALNTLLQSAGALVVKEATIIFHHLLEAKSLECHVQQVAHIHDEFQCLVEEGYEERIKECALSCFNKAGEHFNFRLPIDGDVSIGRNWAETH